jgi:hypothetical protein
MAPPAAPTSLSRQIRDICLLPGTSNGLDHLVSMDIGHRNLNAVIHLYGTAYQRFQVGFYPPGNQKAARNALQLPPKVQVPHGGQYGSKYIAFRYGETLLRNELQALDGWEVVFATPTGVYGAVGIAINPRYGECIVVQEVFEELRVDVTGPIGFVVRSLDLRKVGTFSGLRIPLL